MYLRFYMKRDLADTAGDPSRNFSFASFFPGVLERIVEAVSNVVYTLARFIKIVPDLNTLKTGTMLDKTTSYEKKM